MTISPPVAVCIEMPHHAFSGDQPLVAMERGGYVVAVFSLGGEV